MIIGSLPIYPNLSYVVLVGDDDIVPFRRVQDSVVFGPEREYLHAAHASETSSLYHALDQGYYLTDNYYGTLQFVPWFSRELYIPELAVGRLVESPDEIITVIDAFLAQDGVVAGSALVTGYDFLKDQGTSIADTLSGYSVGVHRLIDDTWSADALRSAPLNTARDLSAVNAHFSHNKALAPDGTILTSQDILNGAADLSGKIIYTLGCRSGLNVPDVDSGTNSNTLDFAQSFARRGATFVANTGTGYGDSSEIALSELLMLYFTQRLGNPGGTTVGEALSRAKLQYIHWAGVTGFGLFDEKVLAVSTLCGLPMYEVSLPDAGRGNEQPVLESAIHETGIQPSNSAPEFRAGAIEVTDSGLGMQSLVVTPSLELMTTPYGSYYTADGEVQARPGRPILPRLGLPIDVVSPTHGVLLVSAIYTDELLSPYVTNIITDYQGITLTFESQGWYPAQMATVNRLELSRETLERMVILPAQYREGQIRKYGELEYVIYYSDSADRARPEIQHVETSVEQGQVQFNVAVSSPAGIERVVVTYTDGRGQWQSVDLGEQVATGQWEVTLAISTPISYFVQAVDGDGDVAQLTNKGRLFSLGMETTYTLSQGWNLIALALEPFVPLTAQTLLDEINAQSGNCTEVDRWQNGGWDAHPDGVPFNRFPIELGRGYFLKCASESQWTLQGYAVVAPVPLALETGWNLVGIPYPTSGHTAQSLLDAIAAQGGQCSEVDRWLNGGWDAHPDNAPFNDFSIEPKRGYFIKCSRASVFTP